MDLPVIDFSLIGTGTRLLRRACDEISGTDASFAEIWKGDAYPVYFKLEEVQESPFDDDPSVKVLYSKSALPFYEPTPPAVAGFPLLYAFFGLALLAAVQPTGKILGRRADTPWILRCFPILYVADGFAAFASWMSLVLVSRNGIRQAASAVFEARHSGLETESWTSALTKAKAATPARWAALVLGVAVPFIDTFRSCPSVHAEVMVSLYALAWFAFEALILAAEIDTDEKTHPVEATITPDSGSFSDSPVLVECPPLPNTTPSEEEEKNETPIPKSDESEVEPNAAAATVTPEDGQRPTSSSTLMTSKTFRYFSATAILVSAIYHGVPLVFPDAVPWYKYLAAAMSNEPVERPDSSLFELAEAAALASFWLSVSTQDLVGEWFSTTGEREQTLGFLVRIQGISGLFWASAEASYLLLGEASEEYHPSFWFAIAASTFLAWSRFGGARALRASIGVDLVDLVRIWVVGSATMVYYFLEEEGPLVAKGVVCRSGGICSRYY